MQPISISNLGDVALNGTANLLQAGEGYSGLRCGCGTPLM